ncbi:MAG: MBL fold metallo-hydrolase, partial [Thermomicrobiaceae bacterium]|nr:MBL fold metallo-hydrolase [Thermomicrobiaceae bacterium]
MRHTRLLIEPITTPGLAQVAYLVGDRAAGVAAVIDPRRDVDEYLARAASLGVRITHVFETHIHADFVSGARELSLATGATVFASQLGEQEFPHVPLGDGQVVEIGSLRLRALWTPGHTPEHVAYLLLDPDGDEPVALFSGDALFSGEVGRPDLLGQDVTEELVGQLFGTVHERLASLPDDVVVYPGHGAGSACGRSIGDRPTTTIGLERRFNYAFQARDRDAFRQAVLADLPPAPTYYPVMKRVNRAGAPLLGSLDPGQALPARTFADRMEQGALVIDTRPAEAFAAAHVPGAVWIGRGPSLVVWAGWLAPYDRDLLLVVEDEAAFSEVRTDLRRIGLDRVVGYLSGGMAAWEASGRPTRALSRLPAAALRERLSRGDLRLLDVRS